jgi:hypothetical protein
VSGCPSLFFKSNHGLLQNVATSGIAKNLVVENSITAGDDNDGDIDYVMMTAILITG